MYHKSYSISIFPTARSETVGDHEKPSLVVWKMGILYKCQPKRNATKIDKIFCVRVMSIFHKDNYYKIYKKQSAEQVL